MEFKLIVKKINNSLSEEETIVFQKWYDESDLHKAYFNKVKENYEEEHFLIDIEKGWESIEKQIKSVATKKTGYLKYVAAASIALLISITFLMKKDKIEEIVSPVIANNNIKIGTDKALLTLEDGTVVVLEKGKQYISENLECDGEELVYKSSNKAKEGIAYNYLTVPRGGKYQIMLSDGTKVWLNSESQIKYPVTFEKGETRLVELVYGEVYFDVSPSTDHEGAKFKVLTESQEVEVLGTEFNISGYKDEDAIYTTLIEGIVAISNRFNGIVLKPGEQSITKIGGKEIAVHAVDVKIATSWRDGNFYFKGKALKEIMNVLSRWYDFDVVFENKSLELIKFRGVLGRNQTIEDILASIKNSSIINNYEINNKTIILK
ncbi:FecR family protein [Wenyingzhuangia sp. 1_MG-2023]|nr:FecR family protein [Wenyingzhuangia sp. 1_MG-2023]